MINEVQELGVWELQEALNGSYYFIAGTGGNLQEWVMGYNSLFQEEEIGHPSAWYVTTGEAVNLFAEQHEGAVHDPFPKDLRCMMFPLEGLNVGKLAILKIRMGDRWFDDVVWNMGMAG